MPDRAGAARTSQLAGLLVRGTLAGAIGRAVYVAGWFALAPTMLRTLGPERFGFWAILSAVSGAFTTFDLGVGQALTKFVAEFRALGDERSRRGVFTIGAGLYVGAGLAWAALLALGRGSVLAFFHVPADARPEMGAALLVTAAGSFALSLLAFYGSALAGLQRFDLWNGVTVAVTLLQLVGVAAALLTGRGLVAVVAVQAIATALGVILCAAFVRRLDGALRLDASAATRALWARMTRFGAALQVINLGVLAQFQLPKILLGRLVSLGAVASWELGARVGLTAWSVPLLLAPPLVPALSHLDSVGDRDRLLRLYDRASRYLVGSGVVIGGALIALSPPLFRAWLGSGQADAARVGQGLGALLALNILTTPGCLVARGADRPWMEARYHLLAALLHVAIGFAIIPRLGVAGALVAVWLAIAAGTAWFLASYHRWLGVPFGAWLRRIALPPLAAAALGAAAAWLAGAGVQRLLPGDSRALALVTLAAGAALYGTVACGLLVAMRWITLAEVAGVFGSLRGGSRVESAS